MGGRAGERSRRESGLRRKGREDRRDKAFIRGFVGANLNFLLVENANGDTRQRIIRRRRGRWVFRVGESRELSQHKHRQPAVQECLRNKFGIHARLIIVSDECLTVKRVIV